MSAKKKGVSLAGSFYFEPGSIKNEHIIDIINQGIGFEATQISAYSESTEGNIVNQEELLSILSSESCVTRLHISTLPSAAPELLIICQHRMDMIRPLLLQGEKFPAYLHLLPALPGFTAGFLEDNFDFFWQNASFLNHYKLFKQPYDPLRVYKKGTFEYIDISQNPGREFALPGMNVTSCWRMWFGGKAFGFFPRSRLLAFDKAHRIEELPNGVVFIELYEDPTAFDLPENRERQRAFREWMKFDEIEANAPELLAQVPTDPIYEMEWLDKKTLRCMTWLDDDLKHVRRSKATQRWVGVARDNWPIYEAVEKPPYRDWQENQE